MKELLEFLKKHSDVDIQFIEQFMKIREGDNLHYPFSIDLDVVIEWLKATKGKMKMTLEKTYTKNIDYIIVLLRSKVKQDIKHGGHNKEKIYITSDTFKMLTLKSKSPDAQKVRYYYITLEKLVEIFKDDIINNQKIKIEKLEYNMKKKTFPVKGAIYIVKVDNDNLEEGYKLGKTKDMNKRYNTFKTHYN